MDRFCTLKPHARNVLDAALSEQLKVSVCGANVCLLASRLTRRPKRYKLTLYHKGDFKMSAITKKKKAKKKIVKK
jgi:hypothetical protein